MNKVILQGNVGAIKKLDSGNAVIRVAVNERVNGEKRTTWLSVFLRKKLAESLSWMEVGARVLIDGKLSSYSNGERSETTIWANSVSVMSQQNDREEDGPKRNKSSKVVKINEKGEKNAKKNKTELYSSEPDEEGDDLEKDSDSLFEEATSWASGDSDW